MEKTTLSEEEFIDLLIRLRFGDDRPVGERFKNEFFYTGDIKSLLFEVRIFLLWIVTISLPPHDRKRLGDLAHASYFKLCYSGTTYGLQRVEVFRQEIPKRYHNYYEGYNRWIDNHSNMILGSVLYETIINQNRDYQIETYIPIIDIIQSSAAFDIFIDTFFVRLCQ
jgi:hypothetical protein